MNMKRDAGSESKEDKCILINVIYDFWSKSVIKDFNVHTSPSLSLSLSPLTIITIIYCHNPHCCIFCQQVNLPPYKDELQYILGWSFCSIHSSLSFPFPNSQIPYRPPPSWNDSRISTHAALQSVSQSPCSRSVKHNLSAVLPPPQHWCSSWHYIFVQTDLFHIRDIQ